MKPAHLSIADALFTKTQQRVLGLLYGRPGRSFYLREIMRIANVGRGSVKRELDKLVQAGLVTWEPRGNQEHFQANPENPVFPELRSIVVKTFGVRDVLRQALADLLPDLDVAAVYGSIAKGEADAASDVDVLLVGDNLSYAEVMTRLEAAAEKLGRDVNPTIYSPDEFAERKRKKQSFITRVLAQPHINLLDE